MKSKNIINTINHMTREGDSRIMDKYIVDFYEKEDGEGTGGGLHTESGCKDES